MLLGRNEESVYGGDGGGGSVSGAPVNVVPPRRRK